MVTGTWVVFVYIQMPVPTAKTFSYQENQRDWKNSLTENGFGNKEFYSQWALSLPILASFQVMKCENKSLRLNVGPYFQYALGGKEIKPSYAYVLPGTPDTGIPHGMSPKRSWDYSSDDKFTMGAQIGAQFDYKKMFFTFDYKHSFIRSQLNCNGFENTSTTSSPPSESCSKFATKSPRKGII